MAETTQPASPQTSLTGVGWCHWHKGLGEDIRLIQVVEQGSGSGMNFFACPPCRGKFNLSPLGEQR